MTAPNPAPGLTLRIGVTGTREPADLQHPHVTDQVSAILRRLTEVQGPEGSKIRLQLLSPLAEGADRLVARCALDMPGAPYELVCPLPFPQQIYEDDFRNTPGSLEEFRRLLGRAGANILALDGARDDPAHRFFPEAQSYEAVGRLIVRNCDLIIGIWDGLPGKGRGGTADTILYAARSGPPVIWIDVCRDTPPRWIEEAHDLRHNAPPRPVNAALALYLNRLLTPPETDDGGGEGVLQGLGHALDWICRKTAHPLRRVTRSSHLDVFSNEKPNPARGIWRLHRGMMRFMAGGEDARETEMATPEDPAALRWFKRYQKADPRAGESAHRYRSSYVWVFVLGALALVAAACSLAVAEEQLPLKLTFTSLEFVVLILIAVLVMLDGKTGWHRRSIEYRLLAELCRKQQALAPLGWVVPRASAWATTDPDPEPEPDAPHAEPISWVQWLFSAWLRDTPLPSGTIGPLWVEHARDAAVRDVLNDQIDYHTARRRQTYRAAKRLALFGEIAFFAVLIVVVWKLVLVCRHLGGEPEAAPLRTIHLLGLAGTILPAFPAAFVGIRAYAELEMLAEQSDAMLKAMKLAKQQINELDTKAPLASQSLGVALAAVATLMLEDLEGWARLFRGKVLDA